MDRKWRVLVKRVDCINTEVLYPIIPKGTKLSIEIHNFLTILKTIDAIFDTQSDIALSTLDTAIKALGAATFMVFDRIKLREVHTNLTELRIVIRPYITQLINAAEVFLKFAEGEKELPVELVQILQNLIATTHQIPQIPFSPQQIPQLQFPNFGSTTQHVYTQNPTTQTPTTYTEAPIQQQFQQTQTELQNLHNSQMQQQQKSEFELQMKNQKIMEDTEANETRMKLDVVNRKLQRASSAIQILKKEADKKKEDTEAEAKLKQEARLKQKRLQNIANNRARLEAARLKPPVPPPVKPPDIPIQKSITSEGQAKKLKDNVDIDAASAKIAALEARHLAEKNAAAQKEAKIYAYENENKSNAQQKQTNKAEQENSRSQTPDSAISKARISVGEARQLADEAKQLIEKKDRRAKGEAIQKTNNEAKKQKAAEKIDAMEARQKAEQIAAVAKAEKQKAAEKIVAMETRQKAEKIAAIAKARGKSTSANSELQPASSHTKVKGKKKKK